MILPQWNRRQVLLGLGRSTLIAAVGNWTSLGGTEIGVAHAAEPAMQQFVAAAYEMRRRALDAGDQAFGAVVVKDGRIVGEGPSRVTTNKDATAHAEMEAIRDAPTGWQHAI